jgi:hypothetical protein
VSLDEIFQGHATRLADDTRPPPLDALRVRASRRRASRRVALASLVLVTVGSAAALALRPLPRSGVSTVVEGSTSSVPGDCARGGPPRSLPEPPMAPPRALAQPYGGFLPVNHVTLHFYQDCFSVRVGKPVTFRVSATGDAERPERDSLTIDGVGSSAAVACAPATPPGPPVPATYDETFRHTYAATKTDVVAVHVGSGCSFYQGQTSARLSVEVLP